MPADSVIVLQTGHVQAELTVRESQASTYYVLGIVTLSVVGATLVNLAISLTQSRERGT